MSIKRRLEAAERKAGESNAFVAYFQTVYERQDGEAEQEYWSASIVDGPYSGTRLERNGDETFEQFQERANAAAKGPSAEEKKEELALGAGK